MKPIVYRIMIVVRFVFIFIFVLSILITIPVNAQEGEDPPKSAATPFPILTTPDSDSVPDTQLSTFLYLPVVAGTNPNNAKPSLLNNAKPSLLELVELDVELVIGAEVVIDTANKIISSEDILADKEAPPLPGMEISDPEDIVKEPGMEISDPILTTTSEVIPDRYLVIFKADRVFSEAAVNSKAAEAEIQFGAKVHYIYDSAVQGYAATLSAQAVEALRKDADVAYIEQDQVFTANQSPGTQINPPWGLDRIDQRSLPLSNSYTYATDGQGVHAYIIDTGIRSSHTEFSGRIGAGYDAVDGGTPDDCHGHGTHVAGTVGGYTYGVAKRVTLHGVRVLNCNNDGTTSGVVAGINWVTANHIKPAVANMSLGGGASQTVDTALRNSVAAGVVYVVAAGNYNTNACKSSPAREPLAITVGATNSSDRRHSTSNYGTCLDIFAPGVDILSSGHTDDRATALRSGTSMASPHVAGVVALYLAGSPGASPADVAARLNSVATTGAVSDPGSGSPNRLLHHSNLSWSLIINEGFEGKFPPVGSSWRIFDGDGRTNGEYFWDDTRFKSRTGRWSAWPARGGANSLSPAISNYQNNMRSWMIYGPFSLSGATDAELLFSYWNKSEIRSDWLVWAASVDGTNFYGSGVSGDSDGWRDVNFNLRNVPTLGNLTGQSSVWIAFSFISDRSITRKGPFIDDIYLRFR